MLDDFCMKCGTLEAQLELVNKQSWEISQLLFEAKDYMNNGDLPTPEWERRANKALGLDNDVV